METPWNRDSHRSIIGYVDEILIMADWSSIDYHIRFRAFGRIHMFSQKWRSGVNTKEEEQKAYDILHRITMDFLTLNRNDPKLKCYTHMSNYKQLDLFCCFFWDKK